MCQNQRESDLSLVEMCASKCKTLSVCPNYVRGACDWFHGASTSAINEAIKGHPEQCQWCWLGLSCRQQPHLPLPHHSASEPGTAPVRGSPDVASEGGWSPSCLREPQDPLLWKFTTHPSRSSHLRFVSFGHGCLLSSSTLCDLWSPIQNAWL